MSDFTRALSQIGQGDPDAAEKLLPLVYDELRKLAAAKMVQEKPGQTLQATALVHEAYLRLVDVQQTQGWNKLRFFAGLTRNQAADALGISVATADNDWAYATGLLKAELAGTHGSG